ncbi:MAG: hypothetical protein B6244_01760 [Candidatus Cloacimonetes bacterium 4572_55]|nr:MAG: hypothetical protein B6244_01760 [Candidatus Cloacimonetes bacterium 4572_55]
MKRMAFFCMIFLFIFASSAGAQVSAGGAPPSFDLSLRQDVETVTLPAVDVDSLRDLEQIEHAQGLPYRFGAPFDTYIDLIESGTRDALLDGGVLWRYKIVATGAYTINLIYDVYWLPENAQFFIYTPDRGDILGAFTSYNNKDHGYFGTGFTRGDTAILEYYEPPGASQSGQIVISRVVNGYKNPTHVEKDLRSFGDSGSCNINVVCPEGDDWQEQIRSVALMTTSSGFRFCTGGLLNNVREDLTPYFLTASHCGAGPTNVFVFNYESSTCPYPGTNGSTAQSIQGATVLTSGQASDFTLVELQETPPESYNVYYAGWDARDQSMSSSVGVHHPSGDVKKITFSDMTGISWPGMINWTDGSSSPAHSHWRVVYTNGVTEPGSSGSPLFNQDGLVVGQLHGGSSSCEEPDEDNYYGKLPYSFPSIRQYLDPDNTGTLTLEGRGAQSSEAQGLVTETDSGDPAPGVRVAFNDGSEDRYSVLTDGEGAYLIEVDPGTYLVFAEGIGYNEAFAGVFTFEEGQTITIDISVSRSGPPPINLTAVSEIDGIVPLSWNPSDGASPTGYNLYRAAGQEDFELIVEDIGETSYNDVNVINGFTYRYAATAIYDNPQGESFFSNEAAAAPGELVDLPILYDFEENDGGLYQHIVSEGTDGETWAWGENVSDHGPSQAPSGVNLWGTGLSENYPNSADIYLLTSFLYLADFDSVRLSFDHWYDFEGTSTRGFDGGNVAVSQDAGQNWTVIDPDAGYGDSGIPPLDQEPGFSGNSEGWIHSLFNLDAYQDGSLMIRFRMASDGGVNKAGWFIDNLEVNGIPLAIENPSEQSRDASYQLGQNYPNPFNPTTAISFQIPGPEKVGLRIYNSAGQLINTLIDKTLPVGSHTVIWNGKNEQSLPVSSGIYFYQIETENYSAVKRMILIKKN